MVVSVCVLRVEHSRETAVVHIYHCANSIVRKPGGVPGCSGFRSRRKPTGLSFHQHFYNSVGGQFASFSILYTNLVIASHELFFTQKQFFFCKSVNA